MKDISAIKKVMDDAVQIMVLTMEIVKKHSVLALPEILKDIKQLEAICADLKPAMAEVRAGLDTDADQAILTYALESMQKILTSIVT